LTCQSGPDIAQHRALSDSFLNEQNESAYASLQSLKRVAAYCLETLDCSIQWTTEGDAEVITRRGNVVVSQASMKQMYKKLLRRCHSILDSMNFPVLSLQLIRKCRDPSSKVPGGRYYVNEQFYSFSVVLRSASSSCGFSSIIASRHQSKTKLLQPDLFNWQGSHKSLVLVAHRTEYRPYSTNTRPGSVQPHPAEPKISPSTTLSKLYKNSPSAKPRSRQRISW
jgi:hypothetical protein